METVQHLRIGLAISHGTGAELAIHFRRVLETFAQQYGKSITLSQSPRIYHSYASIQKVVSENADDNSITSRETIIDAEHYAEWCRQEVQADAKAIFRFSMSAQALYEVRQRLEAAKFELFHQGSASLMMVRDQAQGFYAGRSSYDAATETLSRSCHFQKDLMRRILDYSIRRASRAWPDHVLDGVTLVYKHHLFDGVFDQWAQEWAQVYGISIKFVQPDTNNRNLLASGLVGYQLMVCANEYADIVESFFLNMFAAAVQETSFSESVYLRPDLNCISEYQTVHGSADDIAGAGIVNPTATIKAASAIMEDQAGCVGLQKVVDQVLLSLEKEAKLTPDRGGSLTTEHFLNEFMHRLPAAFDRQVLSAQASPRAIQQPSPGLFAAMQLSTSASNGRAQEAESRTAIIVMDWQNDFIKNTGESNQFRGKSAALRTVGRGIARLLDQARKQRIEVIFIRFIGDEKYQLSNWKVRNYRHNFTTKCLEHTEGAEIASPLTRNADEKVFDKHATFDAFSDTGLGEYLTQRSISHLVMVGIWADICIDASLKSAFQRGYFTTIYRNCTASLYLPYRDWLEYVQKVYGTEVLTQPGEQMLEAKL